MDIMTANQNNDLSIYLQPTRFIDCDCKDIIEYADKVCSGTTDRFDKAIKLYYAVRDEIRYDPYGIELTEQGIKASTTLKKKSGFCVAKAVLLAAVARSQGIASRLGFADVKNHLATERLKELMGTDVFTYHGYTELYLKGKWVKATPAFNISLCERFNVKPLEFDGINDSIFHPFDNAGNKHMEYVFDHGHFPDLPLDRICESFLKHYPALADYHKEQIKGDFEQEALDENRT
jgi:transglutaminase-like putative cysteine protease